MHHHPPPPSPQHQQQHQQQHHQPEAASSSSRDTRGIEPLGPQERMHAFFHIIIHIIIIQVIPLRNLAVLHELQDGEGRKKVCQIGAQLPCIQ
jgi:hypothetical protein